MYDNKIQEWIIKTSKIMKAKEINAEAFKRRLMLLIRMDGCTHICFDSDRVGEYYVESVGTLYGKFNSKEHAIKFAKIIKLNTYAHQRVMWESWEKEGDEFLKPEKR